MPGPGPRPIDLGNPVADHPLNAGLAAWWLPLPNNQGGVTLWDIVRGHNGTLTNGPIWGSGLSRLPGQAVQCDGVDDYIATSGVPSYSSGDYSSTWNLWVRLLSAGNYPMAVTQGATDIVRFGDTNDRTPTFFSENASAKATTALTLGQWTMITGTVGTFSAGLAPKIYINGELSNTGGVNGWANINVSSPQFGRRNDGFYANAEFASIQYWLGTGTGYNFPASKIAALYEQGLKGFPNTLRRYTPAVRVFGGAAAAAPPADTPRPAVLARAEEPPPHPGRALALASVAQPLTPQQSPGEPLVAAAEVPRPEPGRVFASRPPAAPTSADAPRAALVARLAAEPPAPGAAFTAVATAPPLSPQQSPGKVLVARRESRPPFPGMAITLLAPLPQPLTAQAPGVVATISPAFPAAHLLGGSASARTGPAQPLTQQQKGAPPALARAEESAPFAGRLDALHAPAQTVAPQSPPAAELVALPFAEALLAGRAVTLGPAVAFIPGAQAPGRIVVAWTEERSPEPGHVWRWWRPQDDTVPPVPPIPPVPPPAPTAFGGVFRRAEVARVFRRAETARVFRRA